MTIELKPNPNAIRPKGGPSTPNGRSIASRNSLTHGLTARNVVIPGEDQSEFDRLLQDLTADRKPEGELQLQLTAEIAGCIWRLARARDHEAKILEVTYDLYGSGTAKLELVMRYASSIERQMHRAIARLDYCQTQDRRTAGAAEFVSPTPENTTTTTEPAPLAMVAGQSAPYDAPCEVPAASEIAASSETPEFVSQVVENESEPEPLVMAAGSALRYIEETEKLLSFLEAQFPEDDDDEDDDIPLGTVDFSADPATQAAQVKAAMERSAPKRRR